VKLAPDFESLKVNCFLDKSCNWTLKDEFVENKGNIFVNFRIVRDVVKLPRYDGNIDEQIVG
jgi:hypothetical protein